MTKFINYLNEKKFDISKLDLLKHDCLPFLRDLKKNRRFLYSGRRKIGDMFKQDIRKDRFPSDTPLVIHNLINNEFQKSFGVKARSQSLFAVMNPKQSELYGTIYYVFPVGDKYSFIYSKEVKDLFSDFDSLLKNKYNIHLKIAKIFEYDKVDKLVWNHDIYTYVDITKYKTTQFLDMNKTLTKDQFYNIVKKEINFIVKKYKKINNLSENIPEKNEIMVVCDQVWMIKKSIISEDNILNWVNESI